MMEILIDELRKTLAFASDALKESFRIDNTQDKPLLVLEYSEITKPENDRNDESNKNSAKRLIKTTKVTIKGAVQSNQPASNSEPPPRKRVSEFYRPPRDIVGFSSPDRWTRKITPIRRQIMCFMCPVAHTVFEHWCPTFEDKKKDENVVKTVEAREVASAIKKLAFDTNPPVNDAIDLKEKQVLPIDKERLIKKPPTVNEPFSFFKVPKDEAHADSIRKIIGTAALQPSSTIIKEPLKLPEDKLDSLDEKPTTSSNGKN
jgi:hypothetical protein